jgi:UrcA family protein
MNVLLIPHRTCRPLIAVVSIAGLLTALGTAATVKAASPEEVAPSVTVSYNDLNLATEQGAHALYARIVEAARKVCAPRDADALGRLAAPYCQQQATARAVQAVGSSRLAALQAAETKRQTGRRYRLVRTHDFFAQS